MTKREDPLLVAVGRVLKSELANLQAQIDRLTKFTTDAVVDLGKSDRKSKDQNSEVVDILVRRLSDVEDRLRALENKSQPPHLRRVVGE